MRRTLLSLAATAQAAETSVRWIVPTNPQAITVFTGDTVKFDWVGTTNDHNVYKSASQSDFDACVLSGGTEEAPTDVEEWTTPAFDTPGTYYYICTVGLHCENGQKVAVTVTNPPPPPSTPPPDPCFPSSAAVTTANGTTVRLDELKIGDEIVATTAHGLLTTDVVSALSIAKPGAEATFIELTTAAPEAKTLRVTPTHHLPVGDACCADLKQAKDVAVGETLWVVEAGAKAAVGKTVVAKGVEIRAGLHSPVLTHGGFPVVDGLVTAFDRIEYVTLASYLLPYAEPIVPLALALADAWRGLLSLGGFGSTADEAKAGAAVLAPAVDAACAVEAKA